MHGCIAAIMGDPLGLARYRRNRRRNHETFARERLPATADQVGRRSASLASCEAIARYPTSRPGSSGSPPATPPDKIAAQSDAWQARIRHQHLLED